MSRLRNRFLESLNNWCSRQGLVCAHVSALENAREGGLGAHLHILMHLPADAPGLPSKLESNFRKAMNWSKKEFESLKEKRTKLPSDRKSTIHLPVLVQSDLAGGDALGVLRYLAKSGSPLEQVNLRGRVVTLADFNELERMQGSHVVPLQTPADLLPSKRLGSSRTLGEAARTKAGWQAPQEGQEWRCPLLHIELQGERVKAQLRSLWNAANRKLAA